MSTAPDRVLEKLPHPDPERPYVRGLTIYDLAEYFPDLSLRQIGAACYTLVKQGRAMPLRRCRSGELQLYARME